MFSVLTPSKALSFNNEVIWNYQEIMRDAWIEFEDKLDPANGRNKRKINV